ncbi:ABC transporter permease [Gordonia sp. PDNC005]|uniref:ABC transporter permease n=1 Tax=unclassified Gordonia (in: high G+C Gram-positive bacteria) TaxID=2657482 RepID=UPI0019652368|nr:ABC transporter permease [Gordonia sp. PDNC005]QRY64810.1 ABC transporter permease [Gordonia sp. PDNC005]
MRKVSTRSLASHKLRLVLTVFSVVLGTSFVAAAVIFTSTVSNAFNAIFDNVAQGVSVEVTAAEPDAPGVPVELVQKLRDSKNELGIDRLVENFGGPVTVADSSGKAIQTGGAPSVASAFIPQGEGIGDPMTLVDGRAPASENEITINRDAADKAGLHVGSTTKVVLGTGVSDPIDVTIVGLTDLPTSTGGYVGIQFDQQTAEDYFSDGDYIGVVDMTAVPGVSDIQLRDRVHTALGDAKSVDELYKVRTGDQVRADQKEEISQFLTIFRYILLAFAGIGLLVGTFIIYNTFSMIVAQRNRELALLRAIGASRKDVSRSVLTEALLVGVLGGAIGLGLGAAIAAGMLAFTKSQGLPSNGIEVGLSAIASAVFVGIIVTMLSAWIPARRASRIPPVEAMRESTVEPGAGSLRRRTLTGAVLGVLAVAALVVGGLGEGSGPALIVAVGAVLAIVAVVLAAPALSQPFVGALGGVFQKSFGTVGRLARTNAVRNPRRSAATAFALTLGLMLVVVIGTLGSSFKGTINSAVDKGVKADFIITGTNGGQMPLGLADAVRKAPDAQTVVSQAIAIAKLDGKNLWMTAPLGGKLSDVAVVTPVEGVVDVPADGMAVDQPTAREQGWKIGEEVKLTSLTGTEVTVPIVGIYEPTDIAGPRLIGQNVYDKLVPSEAMRVAQPVWVKGRAGVDADVLRSQLEDVTAPYLIAQIQDREQFKSSISSQIDQMMITLYALLGLSLVIAVLGIINTLALSVVERKREIGMLRAIGMARPQVRRSIYLESTYIAVFGALLGAVLGLAIGVPLVRTLAYWGLEGVVIPWSLIGGTLVGAAVVGVIAALWPAVTAARTRPLEAIVEG